MAPRQGRAGARDADSRSVACAGREVVSAEPPDATDPAPAADAPEKRPERTCPNCGAALLERKCKLLCPDPACGYYMSCSDFY